MLKVSGGFARRLALAGAGAMTLFGAASASAATITPNTFNDEFNTGTSCALREAVEAASTDAAFGGCPAGSGADTIPLSTGTYKLSIPDATPATGENANATGDIDDTGGDLSLIHTGLGPTVLDAAGLSRFIDLRSANKLTISGVTVTNGLVDDGLVGGGIRNGNGSLVLTASTVTGNTNAGNNGGGVGENGAGTTTLTNVTLSRNQTTGFGGGLRIAGAGAGVLNNVTVTGNTADSDANANGNGGGLSLASTSLTLDNTIVAGNTDTGGEAPDCDGAVTSGGNNLIGNVTGCGIVAASGDLLGANALLGPLADNGGSTFTHALLAGSPAINKAGADAVTVDQRGAPRTLPDIGAYELVTCGAVTVNRVGTSGDDSLTGTAGADGFLALAGNDTAAGLGGDDALCGAEGRDTLNGGQGKDLALGEAGKDKLKGGLGKDKLKGGPGKDKLKGGGGKDKLKGQGGNDTLIGGKGNDVCNGGAGKDVEKNC